MLLSSTSSSLKSIVQFSAKCLPWHFVQYKFCCWLSCVRWIPKCFNGSGDYPNNGTLISTGNLGDDRMSWPRLWLWSQRVFTPFSWLGQVWRSTCFYPSPCIHEASTGLNRFRFSRSLFQEAWGDFLKSDRFLLHWVGVTNLSQFLLVCWD